MLLIEVVHLRAILRKVLIILLKLWYNQPLGVSHVPSTMAR